MTESNSWSYFTFVAKNNDVHSLDESLNVLGAEGWELASSLTTVKTWVNMTGNDLVLVFKKPGTNLRPSSAVLLKVQGHDPEQAW